jgi:hypothetical protein
MIAFLANQFIGEPETLLQKFLVLALMLIAGTIEGAFLGWFQWRILKEQIPIGKAEWIKVTITVAVLGWFLGMLPSLFFIQSAGSDNTAASPDVFGNPLVFAMLCISSGLIMGAVFGLFQWYVLRRYAYGAGWWILANGLGWAAGLGWIYAGATLPDEQSGILFNILIGALAGVLAGLSVGLVTGLFLKKLLRKKGSE